MKSTRFIRNMVPLLLALLILAACSNLANSPADESELATSAAPMTYYVSTTGNDSNDGKSTAKAFKTLKKALSVIDRNQKIQMRGGTYYADGCGNDYIGSNNFVRSGTENEPITIESYPGERAVIDGRNCRPSQNLLSNGKVSTSNPKLLSLSKDWYIIQNLTFRYGAGRAIYITGNHNVLRNVVSHSHHSDSIHTNGNYNTFERIESYNNYNASANQVNGVGDSADGIKIPYPARGNVVRYFRAYNNSDDGIDIFTSRDTTVEYSMSYRNGRGSSGDGNGYKLGGKRDENGDGTDDLNGPSNNIVKFNIGYLNKTNNFDYNNSNDIKMFGNTSWNADSDNRNGGVGFRLGRDNTAKCNLSYQTNGSNIVGGSGSQEYKNSWNLSSNEGPGFTSTDENNSRFLQVGTTANVNPTCNIYDIDGQEISTSYIGALAPGKTLSEAPFNNLLPQTCSKTSGSNTCGTDSSNFWRPSSLR